MHLLLDTHILLWWLMDSSRLAKSAQKTINEASTVWVSSISAWEIEWKRAKGLLDSPNDLEGTLRDRRLQLLPFTIRHAVLAARVELKHRDPFDRMLLAQAEIEGLLFVTHDAMFAHVGTRVMLV